MESQQTGTAGCFALMIVVRPQRSFPDDRLLHQQVQAEVAKELAEEERFQNLRVEGEGQTLKLRGTVALLEDKRQAIGRVAQMKDVKIVVNLIKVETERIADGLLLAVDSTQGEAQSALDAAVHCSREIHLLNANVESHSCSNGSFPTPPPYLRVEAGKK